MVATPLVLAIAAGALRRALGDLPLDVIRSLADGRKSTAPKAPLAAAVLSTARAESH